MLGFGFMSLSPDPTPHLRGFQSGNGPVVELVFRSYLQD